MDRRRFLTIAAGAALTPAVASLLGACAADEGTDTATGTAATKPKGATSTDRKVKLGFIALTDCASVIMAEHLGYFADRDLEVTIEKQASWPATRDALLNGTIDGAHALFSLPLSVAAGIGGAGTTDLKIAMVLNQNGQAITLASDLADAGYADLAAAKKTLDQRDATTLAMTFPGGTHDTWLRYWLKAVGADPAKVTINPIPPPQMVQNMSVGNMSGYCVGEPWNAVAVKQSIGFTHIATQDLWQHHPEKALVVGTKFAAERDDVLREVMGAVLKAGKWLDEPANRAEAAEVIGAPAFVNAPAAEILGRLTGTYDLGAGLGAKTYEGDQMRFFRDGLVNPPRRSHAIWFLAQYQRFGLIKSAPDYRQVVDELILSDTYAAVAKAEGIDVPDDDMAPFDVVLDEVTFDPSKPDKEATRS